jgi:putative heme-binding domain-containing protein
VHAIWALDAIDRGKSARDAIVAVMDSPDPSLRRQAIRQLGERTTALFDKMRRAHVHDDASVRFSAATALGRMGDPVNVAVLSTLLADTDLMVRFAAFTAMNRIGRHKPEAWEYIVSGLRTENELRREGFMFALRETYDATLVSELAKLASNKKDSPAARIMAIQLLSELCYAYPPWKGEWWAYHPALNPRPEKNTEWSETKVVLGLLRDLLSDPQPGIQRAAIAGIAAAKDSQSGAQLRKMLGHQPDAAMQCALIEAMGKLKDKEAGGQIIAALEQDKSEPAVLAAAIDAAAEIGLLEFARALAGHLNDNDVNIASAALNALAKISGQPATQAIVRSLEDSRPEMRKAAVRILGERRAATAVPDLLKLVDDPQLGPAVLNALAKIPNAKALKAYLKALESKDAALREQTRTAIAKIADQTLPQLEIQANQLPPQVIAELQKALVKHEKARKGPIFQIAVKVLEPSEYEAFANKNPGDVTRGRKLFEDAEGLGCIRCHTVGGKGGAIGPDLSAIGAQFARELLAESILYPSRSIREGYQVFTVKTKRGDLYDGLFKGETDTSVMLLDSAGTLNTIPKDQITSRRASAISLMPEGLQSPLSLEEFADLIAYLQSLKSAHSSAATDKK